MKSDYQKAKEDLKENLPSFSLGEEVKTKEGIGVIVSLRMPHNGLYLSPESAMAVVWFSTQKAVNESLNWVSSEMYLHEIQKIDETHNF